MSAQSTIRFLAVLLLALVASGPAIATGFVSFSFPLSLFFPFWGPAYYPPAYNYPPPSYYPPQQGYYAPNGYAQNVPQNVPSSPVSASASKNCRTYRGDATIDSSGKAFYGRACLEADGRWHVVQQ
jgi:hypothetical protein